MAPPSVRLSAQRAFLGRIHPEMRLVKVKICDDELVVTIIVDRNLSERAVEDVSEAITEILADVPAIARFKQNVAMSDSALPKEDVLEEGWIYQRAEA